MSQSIQAYESAERVARYDRDMDLMHPNRPKMVAVALEFLPQPRDAAFTALDLGCGTGYFTRAFLQTFPNARVVAVDGSASMIDLARARLGPLAAHAEFHQADFRDLSALAGPFAAAFSSYALHHLSPAEKGSLARRLTQLLQPGGWFFNADLIVSPPTIEARIQHLRVAGAVARNQGRDPRFLDEPAVRKFLDDLEAGDADQPQSLDSDLAMWKANGFAEAAVIWAEHREAVVACCVG